MPTPVDQHKTAHQDLHSERGAEPGDRTDRARNPVIKIEDLAWLEFEKPDLDRAERFARDFGLTTAARTPDTLYLRGQPLHRDPQGPGLAVRRASVPRR